MNEEAKIVEILRLFGELETINKTYVSDLLAEKTNNKNEKRKTRIQMGG